MIKISIAEEEDLRSYAYKRIIATMSVYKRNMLKKVNHKNNVQAVPPPRTTMKQDVDFQVQQQMAGKPMNGGRSGFFIRSLKWSTNKD